jgi:V8-like Glu-specific endopeptidase
VVASPGRDLLVTAAHCIYGGPHGGIRSDIVFIPGYRDGKAPYGIWSPARLVVAKGWASAADPDLDVWPEAAVRGRPRPSVGGDGDGVSGRLRARPA